MEDDHVTITLPISAYGLGVIVFVVGVLVMSGVVYALLPRDRPASDWLTRLQKRTGLEGWHPLVFITLTVTWALVALTLFGGLYTAIWEMIFQEPPEGREAVWTWRFSIAQIVALTTVLGAVIALPIIINRLVLTRRQTDTIEQGHITDRINTAVQGLGAEKTVKLPGEDETTQANLEVRIGAIYALERIAQDSDRDHVQIMEILCAYIRQNAPAPAEDDWPRLEMKDGEDDGPLEDDWEERLDTFRQAQDEAKAKLKLRDDIQTALTVIGRRREEQRRLEAGPGGGVEASFPFDIPCPGYDGLGDDHDHAALKTYLKKLAEWQKPLIEYSGYRLDLRNTDLRGADLAGADLKGALLDRTFLQCANLVQARLQGAYFEKAHMQGADLQQSLLQGTDLKEAQLQGAVLVEAHMQRADLWETHLQDAELDGAQLQGANLSGTWLQSAVLNQARLQGANLAYTRLQGADLDQARLQAARLMEAKLQGACLERARLEGTDLTGARFDSETDLSEANLKGATVASTDFTAVPQIAEHLANIFGDASVKLPGGHGPGHESWPAHWPRFDLDTEFYAQWRKWLNDTDGYQPPDSPDPEKDRVTEDP